jgi:hypothetical protein
MYMYMYHNGVVVVFALSYTCVRQRCVWYVQCHVSSCVIVLLCVQIFEGKNLRYVCVRSLVPSLPNLYEAVDVYLYMYMYIKCIIPTFYAYACT